MPPQGKIGQGHWMPLYVGDYLADTQHLTIEQSGAYLHLIMAYWMRGKALPNDDTSLSVICKMPVKRWQQIRPVLESFFDRETDEKFWVHCRVEIELDKAIDKRKKRSEFGKKGANKRWKK